MPRYLLTVLLTGLLGLTLTTRAQISLDGTLGQSGALPGPDYQIGADLGQQHGGNLFHSFRDFNLQSHESATFSGPDNVQNIISRVTGGNPSSIDGTLRSTIPNADMYFLNPYGIMFGKNAKLDVQGGFHASTADYLRLQDGGRFEARVPGNSLLTVAPVAAFGFLTDAPGEIRLQDSKLSVSEGRTLSLIGGDLRLTGSHPYTIDGTQFKFDAELLAPGGRINLASVASQGEVIPTDMDLSLSQVAQRGTIRIQNAVIDSGGHLRGGSVFIRGGQFELMGSGVSSQTKGGQNGGPIDIQVDNLKLWQGSQISSSTSGTGNAGSVVIKADTVEAAGKHESGHVNAIDSGSSKENSGNAGTVDITARQFTLADGARISSSTAGQGQGGTIILKVADNLTLTGSYISAGSFGTMPQAGKAGNLTIQARQLTLTAGGQINSNTAGTGPGGSINIQADSLTIDSKDSYSVIAANSNSKAANAGNAGQLQITARTLTLANGGQINSLTNGGGQGGSITLKGVETLVITGTNATGNSSSGVFASSKNEELEKAGKAGDVTIEARQLTLTADGRIDGSTAGTGQGGSINIQADSLTIDGSGIGANSNSKAANAGNAGQLQITARTLTLANGGQINSLTNGGGQGGSVILQGVETLVITGTDATRNYASGVSASSKNEELEKAGKAGDVTIEARQITLTAGGQINSSTSGTGQGGSILLQGVETLVITGTVATGNYPSGVSTTSKNQELEKAGTAGNITIAARQLTLTAGGVIDSNTAGTGQGGSINIQADSVTVDNTDGLDGGAIAANSNSKEANAGNAGQLQITVRQLTLTNGGQINSVTRGGGQGGSITLKGVETLVITGTDAEEYSSGMSAASQNEYLEKAGKAGDVTIEARQITLTPGGQISSSTYGTGQGGSINIQAESLTIDSKDSVNVIATNSNSKGTNAGNAGQLQITARQLTLTNGAQISSGTRGGGQGGSILLQGVETLVITGTDATGNYYYSSGVFASSENQELEKAGKAGDVTIEARQITLTAGGKISSSTYGTGQGGSINIQADSLTIDDKDSLSNGIATNSNSKLANAGNAGQIKITARTLTLTNGGQINSLTRGGGQGGAIYLQVAGTLSVSGKDKEGDLSSIGGDSVSQNTDAGQASTISIQANQLQLTNSGEISTATNNAGGGDITLITPNLLYLRNGQITTSVKGGTGNGGNININTPVFLVLDKASIFAQADAGKGGNITITANHRLSSKPESNNIIDATSRKNVSGKVVIKAQEEEVSGTLTILPATLKNYDFIKQRCTAEKIADRSKRSKFVKTGRGGVSDAPTQLRSGSVMDITKEQLW